MTEIDSAHEYYEKLAKKSFEKEKILFDKVKMNMNIKSVEGLYSIFENKEKYNEFQTKIKSSIYGEKEYKWIQYLYDINTVKKIVSTGNTKIKKIFNTTYKRDNQNNVGLGTYFLRRKNEDINEDDNKQINEWFRKDGKSINKNTFKKQVKNIAQYILNNDEWKKEIDVKMNEKLYSAIYDDLVNAFLYYDYRHIKKQDNIRIKLFGEGAKKNVKRVFINEQEIIKIVRQSILKSIEKWNEKHTKEEDKLQISFTTSQSIFQLKISEALSNNKKNNIQELDLTSIIGIFYDSLLEALPKNVQEDFKSFWENKREQIEAVFTQNKDHIIKNLNATSTTQLASGSIGEIMFAIFIQAIKGLVDNKVLIIGQEITKSGQGAVDIKIALKAQEEIQKIGFQIKNYSSIKDEIVLYRRTSSIYSEKDPLSRYIQEKLLNDLKSILGTLFIQRHYAKRRSKSIKFEGGEEHLKTIQNLLQESIPYFIAYDQADEDTDAVNNFYILNFNFIPASMIFYVMAKSLKKYKVESLFSSLNIFQFTDKNNKFDPGNMNLIESWDNTFNSLVDFKRSYLSKEDSWNLMKNNIALLFRGIKITFEKEFKVITKM